jgi:ribonuclease HI
MGINDICNFVLVPGYNIFMKLIVHTDGGSRGNPGNGACAFVIEAENKTGAEKIREISGKYLGTCTNNEAEYQAIAEVLTKIKNQKSKFKNLEGIILKSDSLLVVSQLSGQWKIKNRNLQKKVMEIKQLEREVGAPVHYQHIPREINREADAEVNRILNIN